MDSCRICLQPYTDEGAHTLVKLQCGHELGRLCILAWIETQPNCPFCRAPVDRADIIVPEALIRETLRTVYSVIRNSGQEVGHAASAVEQVREVIERIKKRARMTAKSEQMRDNAKDLLNLAGVRMIMHWNQLRTTAGIFEYIDSIADDNRDELAEIVSEYVEAKSWFGDIVSRARRVQNDMNRTYRQLNNVGKPTRPRVTRRAVPN